VARRTADGVRAEVEQVRDGFYAPELIGRLRPVLARVARDEMRVAIAKKLLARA
jgi:hypothetical protein